MNKWLKIGIAAGLVLGAIKLFKMKKVSEKMVSNLSNPRIHKVDLSGIAFRTEIKIQNPTKNSMTITKPAVTLTTNGKYITSNSPEQKTITIKPLTTTDIDTIELNIGWTTLAGYVTGIIPKVPQIVAAFKKKDLKSIATALAIPLEMKYSLYANGIYYESEPEKLM
jgi:LEA14-like dessication related protein